MMNIKELGDKQLILLVLPSQKFGEKVMEIVKQYDEQKILYVTLNNPHAALMKLYREKGIKTNKTFFIDGISAKTKVDESAPNCIYVSAPEAITQLSIAINKTLGVFKPDQMIFDSLSSLLIYLPVNSIIGFCQSLSTKIKGTSVKAVFPIINNKELIDNISMFVDDVVEWK